MGTRAMNAAGMLDDARSSKYSLLVHTYMTIYIIIPNVDIAVVSLLIPTNINACIYVISSLCTNNKSSCDGYANNFVAAQFRYAKLYAYIHT